jgi:hypothetical protein
MNTSTLLCTVMAVFALATESRARTQEEKPKEEKKIPFDFNVSGFLDVSAHWNANNPASQMSGLRSYDAKADSFYLNALHAAASFDFGRGLTAVVEADAGSDASVNKLDPDGVEEVNFDVQEAFVAYVLPDLPFGLKAGKFATTMGIEVIEGPDNPTITRGFLYGLAEPFTHVGFLATWKEGPFDAAVGVVNGWDVVTDNNTGKTGLAKFTVASEDGYGITASLLVGPEQADENDLIRRTADVTGFVSPCEAFRLNVQGLWGDDEVEALSGHRVRWYGFGLQPVATFTKEFSIGFRAEWFRDVDGARTGYLDEVEVWNVAAAPALRVTEHLTVRVEGRFDKANEDLFEDEDGLTQDRQATLSGEVIVRF